MRRARPRILLALGLLAVSAAGCQEFGYVEVKAVPVTGRAPALFLDSERVQPPASGTSVLRQATGTRKLQSQAAGGQMSVMCEILVRKDRITTVTVSTLDRPPRCQCARSGGNNAQGQRICIG
jgi:hypothetical protein